MTNFEKWKSGLTPEDMFTNYGIFEFCGKICPAQKYCKTHKRREDAYSRNRHCAEIFFEWANKEAE